MRTLLAALIILLVSCTAYADDSDDLSSIQKYKTPATTQKAYQLPSNVKSARSQTVEYDHRPAHEVFNDDDSDGRFGEKEAALDDADGDGRTGEREAQLGVESAPVGQQVTFMNNMGLGKTFSSFQAAGQTQRSSIFVEDEETDEDAETGSPQEDPGPAAKKDAGKNPQVLIS
jgi:hypothetical protein